jgi:hypothetical protein
MASVFVAVPFMTLGPTAALAESPAVSYCQDVLGGVYSKDGGEVSCIVTTVDGPGNSPPDKRGAVVTTEDATTSNGTFNNQPQKEETSQCLAGSPPGQCR